MTNLKIVKEILSQFYDTEKNPTYIFGSRAKEMNRPDSDLDILIDDHDIDPSTVSAIEEAFENSSLRYKIDLVLKSRIDESFFQKISSQLIQLN